MKEQFHSRIAKLLVVLALAVVASVMFVFVGCAPQEEPAPEHTHTWETVTVDPSCGTDGYTYQECSCGEERNYRVLPATGEHEWETVTENATCTSNGYTVQVCKNCGTEGTRTSIAALGHDYEVVEEGAVAATCTAAGYHFEECTRCHDRKQISDPALGHDLVAGTPIAATCTTNGYTPYECSRCDYTEQRNVVEASGHDFGELLQYIPTDCTQDGYYYRLCANCDYRETSSVIKAKGHIIDFDAKTTVITPLTCEADGSVEFVCEDCNKTLTATADQIKDGTVRFENLPTVNPQNDKKVEIDSYFAFNGPKYGSITADNAAEYFLQSYGHDYSNEWKAGDATCKADPDIKDNIQGSTKQYYSSCDRCGALFEVTDHTAPTGALPCVSINDNPNFDEDDFKDVEGLNRDTDAYVCTKCKEPVAVKDHDYKVQHLVSGTVNYNAATGEWEASKTDAPVWEAATEALNCTYYYVCADCGKIEIAQPHNTNGAEPTCTEGVYCTVCGALVDPATGHDELTVGIFGDYKSSTIVATCTEPAYTIYRCQACFDREKAGEEVEWVEGENYKLVAQSGSQAAGHKYVAQKVYDETSTAVGCARPYWMQDVCSVCKHVRVSEKPTVYQQVGNNYVAVTTALATTGVDYYTLQNGAYVPFTDISNYNANNYATTEGAQGAKVYAYTDSEGLYGYVDGGSHTWVAQYRADYATNPEFSGLFVPANCMNDEGKVLYTCSACGYSDWRSISLGQYYNLMENKSAEGINDNLEEAVEKALADKDYHVKTMLACGHSYCYDCVPANTNHTSEQWSITFVTGWNTNYATSTAVPQIDRYVGWGCRSYEFHQGAATPEAAKEAENNLYNTIMAQLAEKYKDYNFNFYKDATYTTEYTADDWAAIGYSTVADDQYNQYLTMYVKVTPKAVTDVFGGIGWLANGSLSTDIHLNDTWVDLSEIDSIEIAYIRPDRVDEFGRPLDNYVMASATSEGAGLEALKKVLKVNDTTKDWNFTCGYFLQPEYVDDLADPDGYWTWVINDTSFVATNGYYNTNASGAGAVQNCSVRLTVTIGNNVMTWTMAF